MSNGRTSGSSKPMRSLAFGCMGILALFGCALSAAAQPPVLRVGRQADASFHTVQEAVDHAPASGATILLAPGTYREKVHISTPNIHLVGTGVAPEEVVLSWNDSAASAGGTGKSGTVSVDADGFAAENLTIENTWELEHTRTEEGSQAVALLMSSDRAVLDRVRLLGAQDTLYANSRTCHEDLPKDGSAPPPGRTPCRASRQYFRDVYVEGHVDYIFGDAKAVFDHCELHPRKHDTVMLTAQSRHFPEEDSGYYFLHTRITGANEGSSIIFGRPWRDYSTVLFYDTKIEPTVKADGWSDWGGRLKTSDYREYKSHGPGVNGGHRIVASPPLTAAQETALTPDALLAGTDGWKPVAAADELRKLQQSASTRSSVPEQKLRSVAAQAKADGSAMAATVRRMWPTGVIPAQARPGAWAYEVGTLLDGMAANGDRDNFAYVRATVDRWVDAEGNINTEPGKPFNPALHTLDNLEPGRAVLLCYRRTGDAKYAKAAKYLFEQFAAQPRNHEGGYWHKEIYPDQMWLDGAFMAEPFRAAYAHDFHQAGEFDDIARQFLLMYDHMRVPATGLLRHGWDAARKQPWADRQTGLSQEVWARALGWYTVALVDTLPSFPMDHPMRPKLVAVLQQVAQATANVQDAETGTWWDVMDKGGAPGNFREASATAMFTYAFAKGVRLGYLPARFYGNAVRGWNGLESQFITRSDGALTLHGTVKVSGLGGTPYRAGDYSYYVHEAVGDNDAKGVGAYLLAASELAQADTATTTRPMSTAPTHRTMQ